jgi:hypothetical protein
MPTKTIHTPVDVRQVVSPATLQVAVDAAGGDRSRLEFNNDGSITVLNKPRTGDPNRQQ